MSSSRTAAAVAQTVRPASLPRLVEAVEQVRTRGRVVGSGTAGVADQEPTTQTLLGLSRSRPPSEPTIRRVFTAVDADALDRVLGAWMWTRTGVGPDGRRVISLDGKTPRGAREHRLAAGAPGSVAPHLVSAYDHSSGTVLGQVAVVAKSNEIPAVRLVLKGFDLHNVVVVVTQCTRWSTPQN